MLPTTRNRRFAYESPFDLLEREMRRFVGGPWPTAGETEAVGAYPGDIREDDGHIYIDAEMPGFTKDQVEITLERNVITIHANRKTEKSDNGGQPQGETHLAERRFTRVARSFSLPSEVDENKVEARLDNGVLRITLTKHEASRPRPIEVS